MIGLQSTGNVSKAFFMYFYVRLRTFECPFRSALYEMSDHRHKLFNYAHTWVYSTGSRHRRKLRLSFLLIHFTSTFFYVRLDYCCTAFLLSVIGVYLYF